MSRIRLVLKHISESKPITPEIIEECRRALKFLEGKDLEVPCIDCSETDIEYYMVNNSVWNEASLQSKCFCCITCLETRLGRRLIRDDFKDVPVNKLVRRMMV